MTKKEKTYVNQKIDHEGFDYCFVGYSDFEEIKDKKFQELREAYVKAAKDLTEYLGYKPQ